MSYDEDFVSAGGLASSNKCSKKPSKGAALESSTGGAGPLPIITTTLSDPISVVSSSIDTTKLGKSNILLIFSCIINLPLSVLVTLNFQIKRSLNDGPAVKVGSTYTFSTVADVLEAESFVFQFADEELIPGQYTYTVELSTNSIISVTPGVTINNATLSLIAVSD